MQLSQKGSPRIGRRMLIAWVLCALASGCTTSDVRMSALRGDMAARQAAAEQLASRGDAPAGEKERAKGYASAQSCIDQIQAHSRRVQATSMAVTGAMAAVSLAGPAGALAARTMGPVNSLAVRNQGQFSVACY